MTVLRVSRRQVMAHRLSVHRITERLPAGSYVRAARFGLQDSAPRDALIGLHARVEDCEPEAWCAPGLIQTYSPRAAVYVLPEEDFGIFTRGRLPLDADASRPLELAADRICRELDGAEGRSGVDDLRAACATGRIALRWTTSALYFREVARPDIDPEQARRELCRRHLRGFGPTTPAAYAWWSGLSPVDARQVWRELESELIRVECDGVTAWLLSEDEALLRDPPPPGKPRFLVAPELRLLGQDRTCLFVGPGQRPLTELHDTFHPGGLLVDGEVVGAWGRRGGRIAVRVPAPLSPSVRAAVEAEALTMPIPGATMSITITEAS